MMTSGDDPRRGDFKLRDACRSHAAVSGAGVRARTNRYVRWHCRSRAARPPVGGRGPPAFTEGVNSLSRATPGAYRLLPGGGGFVGCRLYDRHRLTTGAMIDRAAVVEEFEVAC